MNAPKPATVVHFYDTRTHDIPCGVHGADHRSTKHLRDVTCHSCVGLLRERATMPTSAPAGATTGGAP